MMFTNEVNIMNDKEKQQNHRTTMKQLTETCIRIRNFSLV